MTEIYDAAVLSRRERSKLVTELIAKSGQLKTETNRRSRAMLVKRILEIDALLRGKANQPAEQPVNEPPAVVPDDPWLKDKAVLDQIIDRTHPQLADPALVDAVLTIYDRWKDDDEKMAVVNQAVDEWAKFAVELTADL